MNNKNGFQYIEEVVKEQKAYRKAKRSELLREVANWSLVIIAGTLFALLLTTLF